MKDITYVPHASSVDLVQAYYSSLQRQETVTTGKEALSAAVAELSVHLVVAEVKI